MALGISEEEYKLIKESWDSFISLVREKLDSNLRVEHRELGLAIDRLDMLARALRYKPDDMNLILPYRNVIVMAAPEVEDRIKLLDAFEQRSNLDNDIAVETYKSIVHDTTLLEKIESKREEILEKRDQLYKKMLDTADLINGRKFTYDLMLEYIKEFNLSKEQHNMVLFAGFNTIVKNIEQRKQARSEALARRNSEQVEVDEIIPDERIDTSTSLDEQIKKYEDIKNRILEIENKYRDEIDALSLELKSAYDAYAKCIDDASVEDIPELQYDEVRIKVEVINLIRKETKISDDINAAKGDTSQDSVYAGVISEEVEEYEKLVQRVELLEQKIITTKVPDPIDFSNSKLFFLTDHEDKPFIPQEIIKDHLGSIRTFEAKVNSGDLLTNQGVRKVKGAEDCESWINKTIFMQTGRGKPIFTYVKVNLINEDEPEKSEVAVAVITVCTPKTNLIKEATKEVLRPNRDHICEQLERIQHRVPEEMERQTRIRESIFGNTNTDSIDLIDTDSLDASESGKTLQ